MRLRFFISFIAVLSCFVCSGQDKNLTRTNLDSLFSLSREKLIEKNYIEANILLERLIKVKNDLPSEKIPVLHNNLGVAKYGIGDFTEGVKHYKIALSTYEEWKNDTLTAQALLNLGMAYKEIGADSLSSKMLFKAIYLFRELDLKKEEVSALSSLGNLYKDGRQFQRSEFFLKESLKLSKEIDYSKGVAYAFHGLGTLMIQRGEHNTAEKYLLNSLHIKDSMNLKKHAATTCAKLGELYLTINRCDEAKIYLKKSIALRTTSGQRLNKSSGMNYFHLGNLNDKCGVSDSSIFYYLKAIEIFERQSSSSDLLRTYEALLDIYKNQKRTQEALEISSKIIELKEIILADKNQKEMAKLAVEYDVIGHQNAVKLKEQENELLNLRNIITTAILIIVLVFLIFIFMSFRNSQIKKRKIEKQNDMLSGKNRDIITLHDELAHRTNNFFSLLQGMLQADSLNKELSKDELILLYENRIQAMADVQHHLVLGTDDSVISVDFKAYLLELIENSEILYSKENLNSIKHNIRTLSINLTKYEVPTRLGIILNELINNSVKHNRELEGGVRVKILFETSGQQLRILYNDNGLLNSSDSVRNGSGLSLIKDLLVPISGSVEYPNHESFKAIIMIPIKKGE